MSSKVLVTGGTGYLGGWTIIDLLQRGYDVRTTVRDLRREADVREVVAKQVDAGDRLEVVAADLSDDAGWAEAVDGCRYVLHLASPFPPAQPKDPDYLIVPARDGALRVIKAALAAGVERIVLTSSVAAVRHGHEPKQGDYDEGDWTDGDDTSLSPYTRSKTIAELAAWEHVRAVGAEAKLATVNPGAIIGPVLGEDRSYSLQAIERLLGGMPAIPKLGFSFVDVRDVADLHIRAMTDPAAAGQRFLAVGPFLWFADVAGVLRERLPAGGPKITSRVAPNVLIRALAIFDPALRSVVADLGHESSYTNEKARTRLGWEPRPIEDSITECAESLMALGVVG